MTAGDKASASDARRYWDEFYASVVGSTVPSEPSGFAAWVAPHLATDVTLVECGFGNARDSLWFARAGRRLRGFDFAHSAVEAAEAVVAGHPELDARFVQLDLGDVDAVQEAAASVREDAPHAVYGRFLLHALHDGARHNFLALAAELSADLYVEFRTGKDAGQRHVFGDDHFRTYLDPEAVIDEITGLGAVVLRFEQGHGLAPYKSEDPHVARVVASWRHDSSQR